MSEDLIMAFMERVEKRLALIEEKLDLAANDSHLNRTDIMSIDSTVNEILDILQETSA